MEDKQGFHHRCSTSATDGTGHWASGRARVLAEWVLVLLVAVGLLLAYVSLARATTPEMTTTHVILVEPGDSLWSLARNNPAPGLSTAETSRLIAELNGLEDSTLHAGARIQVPGSIIGAASQVAHR